MENKHGVGQPSLEKSTLESSVLVNSTLGQSTMSVKVDRSELSRIYGNEMKKSWYLIVKRKSEIQEYGCQFYSY